MKTTDCELHSHTRHSDGTSPPSAIAEAAKRAGLDVVCLTDHHSNVGANARGERGEIAKVQKALERVGVLPIVAVEYSTAQGHLLVYGLDVPHLGFGEYPEMQDVIDRVNDLGGVCIVPHPFAGFSTKHKLTNGQFLALRDVAAVESFNAKAEMGYSWGNRKAKDLAAVGGFRTVVASDAHSAFHLGEARVRFPKPVGTEVEFLAALRAGEWECVIAPASTRFLTAPPPVDFRKREKHIPEYDVGIDRTDSDWSPFRR